METSVQNDCLFFARILVQLPSQSPSSNLQSHLHSCWQPGTYSLTYSVLMLCTCEGRKSPCPQPVWGPPTSISSPTNLAPPITRRNVGKLTFNLLAKALIWSCLQTPLNSLTKTYWSKKILPSYQYQHLKRHAVFQGKPSKVILEDLLYQLFLESSFQRGRRWKLFSLQTSFFFFSKHSQRIISWNAKQATSYSDVFTHFTIKWLLSQPLYQKRTVFHFKAIH